MFGMLYYRVPAFELSSYLRPLVDGRGAARRGSDVDLVAGVHEHAVRGRRFLQPKACDGERIRHKVPCVCCCCMLLLLLVVLLNCVFENVNTRYIFQNVIL